MSPAQLVVSQVHQGQLQLFGFNDMATLFPVDCFVIWRFHYASRGHYTMGCRTLYFFLSLTFWIFEGTGFPDIGDIIPGIPRSLCNLSGPRCLVLRQLRALWPAAKDWWSSDLGHFWGSCHLRCFHNLSYINLRHLTSNHIKSNLYISSISIKLLWLLSHGSVNWLFWWQKVAHSSRV